MILLSRTHAERTDTMQLTGEQFHSELREAACGRLDAKCWPTARVIRIACRKLPDVLRRMSASLPAAAKSGDD